MEINYKTIIKYLCVEDNDQPNDDFPTRKNIMISSDNFPDNISKFLSVNSKNKFYRYGVTRYNDEQINISFLSSFLTLLDKKFITLDKKEESNEIKNFISQIREKVMNKKFKFELKYKFENQVILDRLETLNFEDGLIIQVLVQLLEVNMLVFDFKEGNIQTFFSGDYYNPWRVTLLLAKKDKNWEPLFCDKKQFCYNDSFLKKILTTEEILYYNESYLNKSYTLLDNISELSNVDDEENISIKDSESDNENLETFINPIEEIKNMKLTKTKLKNLKKDQIYELVNRLNLDIQKDVNKNEMIKNLLPYI